MRVFVTGYGMISAIGLNKADHWNALQNQQSGLSKAQYINSKYVEQMPLGEVKKSNNQLRAGINFDLPESVTRTELLAFIAFQEAVQQSGLSSDEIASFDTSLISASTVGGMCMTDELYDDANFLKEKSPFVSSYGPAVHTMRLAEFYNIKGYTDTINTACSSSANAVMIGMKLIQSGKANRVIVGGADSLAKFTINGFNSLQILSNDICRPFDLDRKGLNLGEGAAFLVLESEEVVGGKSKLAEVVGYGNSNDAYHPSALSDDAVGVVQAMNDAIDVAQIKPSDIQYVNAHGTATPNNDQVEYTGLEKVFKTIPAYQSTKSYMGHTLGAAGALESAIGILCMNHQEVCASINYETPLTENQIAPIMQNSKISIDYFMTNSFGFAGNCTSLIFSRA